MKNLTDLPGKLLAFSDDNALLPRGCTLLCALSGGADSMALLTGLLAVAEDRDLTILAEGKTHYAFAYVWNKSDDDCSEFGTVVIKSALGGITRIG